MRAEREDREKKRRATSCSLGVHSKRPDNGGKQIVAKDAFTRQKKVCKLVSVKLREVGVRFCGAASIHSNSLPTRDAKRCQTAT